MIKLKFWFLRYYWIGAITVFMGTVIYGLVGEKPDWKIIGSLLTGVLSFIYFVQKKKIEEMSLFKELFEKFNARYDGMNENLNKIFRKDPSLGLEDKEKDTLYNYFNLCGEEYLCYRRGYIFPEVWESWLNGMRYFYQNDQIKKLWKEELQQNSYYRFKVSILEKS